MARVSLVNTSMFQHNGANCFSDGRLTYIDETNEYVVLNFDLLMIFPDHKEVQLLSAGKTYSLVFTEAYGPTLELNCSIDCN